jgi:hypothetical protein
MTRPARRHQANLLARKTHHVDIHRCPPTGHAATHQQRTGHHRRRLACPFWAALLPEGDLAAGEEQLLPLNALAGTVKLTLIMIFFTEANTRYGGHVRRRGWHFVFASVKKIMIKVNLTVPSWTRRTRRVH